MYLAYGGPGEKTRGQKKRGPNRLILQASNRVGVVLLYSALPQTVKQPTLLDVPAVRRDNRVRQAQEMFGGYSSHFKTVEVLFPLSRHDPHERLANIVLRDGPEEFCPQFSGHEK